MPAERNEYKRLLFKIHIYPNTLFIISYKIINLKLLSKTGKPKKIIQSTEANRDQPATTHKNFKECFFSDFKNRLGLHSICPIG